MALIKCPECSSEISDTANSCIKCGYVLKKTENKKEGLSGCAIFFIIMFITLIIIIVSFWLLGKNQPVSSSQATQQATSKQYYMKESVIMKNFTYSVDSVKWQRQIKSQSADGTFLIINLFIRNKSSIPQRIPELFLLNKISGEIHQQSSVVFLLDDGILFNSLLNPNVMKYGKIVFDVTHSEDYILSVYDEAGNVNNPELINLTIKK